MTLLNQPLFFREIVAVYINFIFSNIHVWTITGATYIYYVVY